MLVTFEVNNDIVLVCFEDVLGRTACCGGRNYFAQSYGCCHVEGGKAVLKWRVFVMIMTFLALLLLNRMEMTRESAF